MCGIIGAYEFSSDINLSVRIEKGIRLLSHRGPDDSGIEVIKTDVGSILLGHTRLSIIDLTSGGHQPMKSLDDRFTIVFNGEIYNYRELREELIKFGYIFETDSDTEVLLNAWIKWGVDVLKRLTGMFAFAVFDRISNNITLIRDAFGIKPMFYSIHDSSFYFASEIQPLLRILKAQPNINESITYNYLTTGQYDNSEQTFLEGIHHLLPGNYLSVNLDNLSKNVPTSPPIRWWWPSIKVRTDLSFNEAAEKLREMFLSSVRLHLRSDVPVGAALSGGLDSSAVVCAMRYLEPEMPIHTFSFIAKGSQVSEEYWVDLINNYTNAIPNKIFIDPVELANDLDDMISTQGEPFGSTSIYAQYRVFKAAREAGIIVTLDGQGADEMLAGYKGYPYAYLRSMLDDKRYAEIPNFLYSWSKWPGRSLSEALSMLIASLLPSRIKFIAKNIKMRKPAWFIEDDLNSISLSNVISTSLSLEGKGRRLVEALRFALTGNGLTSLLRHGDRNSMRWSIESRVPFLTIEMAEFLLSLPESYLLSPQGQTKHLFRAALRGIVPDEVLDRRDKIGFETPEKDWLSRQRVDIVRWISEMDQLSFLNKDQVNTEIVNVLDGRKRFDQRIWRLINIARWSKTV